MAVPAPHKDFYDFGPFRVDPLKRLLLRDNTSIPLPPKVFDTLLYLIEHADRLLDKDELLHEIWPGRIVEEDNLFHNISLLRKALEDDGLSERYIVTSPGHGYRFTAALQRVPPDSLTTNIATNAAADSRPPVYRSRWWPRVALSFAAIILIAGMAFGAWQWFQVKSATPISQPSIAVLPFENLSDDKANAWLAAGIQDEILTRLADLGRLKVISRTSSDRYSNHPGNLKDIGLALGVADVLEGSVQRAGDEVRVNVQLIDTRTDAHLWAHTYDRGMGNIFDVETNVAGKVADALQLTLLPAEAATISLPSTQDASAYDLFLHAEYLRNKAYAVRTPAGLDAALDLYTQALARDPKFALAYARRSGVESFLFWRGASKRSRQQLATAALRDANQALAMQPELADAHLAMGYYDKRVLGNFPQALQEFDAALKARPNDTDAMTSIASILSGQGHWQDSIRWYNAAFAHDPNNHVTAHYLAYTYWEARQYALADQMFQRALALDPDDVFAASDYSEFILFTNGDAARAWTLVQGNGPMWKLCQAQVLAWQRNYRDAISAVEGVPDVPSIFSFSVGPKALMLGRLYQRAGDMAQARPLLLQARAQIQAGISVQPPDFAGVAYMWQNLAAADAALGDQDAALAAARRALATLPTNKDQVLGLNIMRYVAEVYADMGRADLAVPLIKQLLVAPGAGDDISPVSLRQDSVWDPIRGDAHFEVLLKQQVKAGVIAGG